MKRKLIIVGSIILISLGIVIGYFYLQYIRSPKYSLLQAKKAFEKHDITTFKKYVDVEGIASNLIDQTIEAATSEEKQSQNEWEQLGENIAKGMIILMKPRLVNTLKEQIIELVETGKFDSYWEGETVSLSHILEKASGKNTTNFRGIKYIKKDGKLAYVGLEFFSQRYDTSLVLELKLRNKGNYWQVAKINNFDEYMKKIEELEEQRVSKLNKPIWEKMNKILVLKKLIKYPRVELWGLDKKVIFEIEFQNVGKKEIDEYEAVLVCKTLEDKVIKKVTIKDNKNIPPGKVGGGIWFLEVNTFDEADSLLYTIPQSKLKISLQINRIRFTDGEELKAFKKWEN